MNTTEAIKQGEEELIKLDPKLGSLVEQQRPLSRAPRTDYFASLVRAIVGQQVSVAAATAIYGRLQDLTGIQPTKIVNLSDKQVHSIGLSRQKTAYLRDLARHFTADPDVYNHLEQASDEDVVRELTAIKGIGAWTAQMFLMFTLARLDVFAPGDAGLQRAMCQLYGWADVPTQAELEAVADAWRPYRTVACWHLWESLNNAPA